MSEIEKLFEELKTLPRSCVAAFTNSVCSRLIGRVRRKNSTQSVVIVILNTGRVELHLGRKKLIRLGNIKEFNIPVLVPEITRILQEAVTGGRARKIAEQALLKQSRERWERERERELRVDRDDGGDVFISRKLLHGLIREAAERCIEKDGKGRSGNLTEMVSKIINETGDMLGLEKTS